MSDDWMHDPMWGRKMENPPVMKADSIQRLMAPEINAAKAITTSTPKNTSKTAGDEGEGYQNASHNGVSVTNEKRTQEN